MRVGPGFVVALIVIIFTYCFLFPWITWRFIQLWLRKECQILWVRRSHLDIYMYLSTVFGLLFTPIVMLAGTMKSRKLYAVFRFSNSIGVLATSLIALWRIISMHIDLTIAFLNKELSWQTLIVTDEESKKDLQQSNYLLWQNTWLKPHRLALFFVAYFFLGLIVMIVSLVLTNSILSSSSVNIPLVLFGAAVAASVWCVTPKIADTIGVRQEVLNMVVIAMVGGIFQLSLNLYNLIRGNPEHTAIMHVLLVIPTWFGIGAYMLSIVEWRWLILPDYIKNQKIPLSDLWANSAASRSTVAPRSSLVAASNLSQKHSPPENIVDRVNRNISKRFSVIARRPVKNEDEHIQQVSQVVSQRLFADCDCVSLFADFVFHEMSIENLIGFIEFYQYSKKLRDSDELSELITNSEWTMDEIIMAEDDIPMSTINQLKKSAGSDFKNVWHYRFSLLFEKYISLDGRFELNVPFRLAKKCERYRTTFPNNLDDIFKCCDKILKECLVLIKDSFARFQSEPHLYKQFMDVEISVDSSRNSIIREKQPLND